MKKLLLASILLISTIFAIPSLAATHNSSMMNVIPSSMQSDMQKMTQKKAKWIANKMMYMGIKMYAIGKTMMSQNIDSATANEMMSNGIKLYNMGMKMNGGNSMDMGKCKTMCKMKR